MTTDLPAAIAQAIRGRRHITIRDARSTDADGLRQLALLSDRPLPRGALLVAESDGDLVAAVSPGGAGAISDPFRATEDVVALLELRAAQLRQAA